MSFYSRGDISDIGVKLFIQSHKLVEDYLEQTKVPPPPLLFPSFHPLFPPSPSFSLFPSSLHSLFHSLVSPFPPSHPFPSFFSFFPPSLPFFSRLLLLLYPPSLPLFSLIYLSLPFPLRISIAQKYF